MFIRSPVGLEEAAAKDALSGFLRGSALNGDQIRVLGTGGEVPAPERDHAPRATLRLPFTAHAPQGPEQIFPDGRGDELVHVLDEVGARATAS